MPYQILPVQLKKCLIKEFCCFVTDDYNQFGSEQASEVTECEGTSDTSGQYYLLAHYIYVKKMNAENKMLFIVSDQCQGRGAICAKATF